MHITPTLSLQKRIKTPSKLFMRSGPGNKTLFNDTPSNSADTSNTTHTLVGFLGWYTPKCGKYQTWPLCPCISSDGTRPQNKSGRYTGHYDQWITKFTGHSGIYAGHCHSLASFPPLHSSYAFSYVCVHERKS